MKNRIKLSIPYISIMVVSMVVLVLVTYNYSLNQKNKLLQKKVAQYEYAVLEHCLGVIELAEQSGYMTTFEQIQKHLDTASLLELHLAEQYKTINDLGQKNKVVELSGK